MQRIKIRISKKTGEAQIQVIEGFTGDACLAATAPIEAAMGVVTDRKRKNEFTVG
jgi:hypothetical protein